MKMHILALRDIKADCYGLPMFVPNIAAAVRNFGDQIKDKESGMLHTHPEDFELYLVGEYDDQDAGFQTEKTGFEKRRLALGADFITNR